jgi:tetratricopeptide (TPR) repeat protein
MRAPSRPAVLLLTIMLILSAACNRGPDLPDAGAPAPPVKNQGAPVTEGDARQFAAQLSRALTAGDMAEVDRLLHLMDLVERLAGDLGLPAAAQGEFLKGARTSLQRGGFAQQIRKATADGGSYELLRVHPVNGQGRALFRMVTTDGSINYHDYTLARFPNGVGMEDVYVYASGELLSQTVRRIVTPLLVASRGGFLGKGPDNEYVSNFPTLQAMMKAAQEGQWAQAAADYRRLPQQMQDNKAILVLYMQTVAQGEELTEKDYLAAMEKFRKLFPDDPALNFISIDYYFLKKRYDDALKAVDGLDRAIGGDPYLGALRAGLLVEARRYDEARPLAEKAIQAAPTVANAYGIRLLVSLREKNFVDTLQWLKKLVQACNAPMDDLPGNPEYAEFVRSPQYREWLAWYRARPMKK